MNCGMCDGAGTIDAVPGSNYVAISNGRAICPFCAGRGKAFEATPDEENILVGRYARTLPAEHYGKMLKRVDYSGKPQEEQDRLVGVMVRSGSTVLKFQQILRSGRGYFKMKERRDQGEAAYQKLKTLEQSRQGGKRKKKH